jgi:hypothetical protein
LVAQQALQWPEIRRLMTVPGVNLICASTFMAAVGDPSRFFTSRKLVAYLGLDPKVRQSGDAPARSGRISKRGSASGAGRWSRRPGALSCSPARCTRSMTAHARAAAMASDRCDRPQAGGPVLVQAQAPRGLRPSATLTDQEEAPPAGDHCRRPEIRQVRGGSLERQRRRARGRARARSPGRDLLQAARRRSASRCPGEKGGRERDTGARRK